MTALSRAKQEIASRSARLQVQTDLRILIPPATKYVAHLGANVYVYRGGIKALNSPYKVDKVSRKRSIYRVMTTPNILTLFKLFPTVLMLQKLIEHHSVNHSSISNRTDHPELLLPKS